jgi:hypothetical protein
MRLCINLERYTVLDAPRWTGNTVEITLESTVAPSDDRLKPKVTVALLR